MSIVGFVVSSIVKVAVVDTVAAIVGRGEGDSGRTRFTAVVAQGP